MSIRDKSFSTRSVLIAMAIAVTAAIAITIGAQHALFNDAAAQQESDGATVRISALKSESGAVRVALQQQGAGGSWSERQHPDLNTVGATARTGVWLNSSPLQVTATSAQDGPLYCIVAHGESDDLFWIMLRAHSQLAARLAEVNLRFELHPDGADQASAIDRCRLDGAVAIASTLAQPDRVTESLLAAKAEGARIVTFNSGASYAAAAGAEIHVALDDWEAGRRAAAELNRHDVDGWVGCLLHERANVGLEERCDAIEDFYEGAGVVRIQLTPGGSEHQQEIAARLMDTDEVELEALLALNVDTLFNTARAANDAYQQTGHVVQVASIGSRITIVREIPAEVRNRHVVALISDSVYSQGFLTLSAMQLLVNGVTSTRTNAEPEIWLSTPFTVNLQAGRGDIEEIRRSLQRLLELEAAADDN